MIFLLAEGQTLQLLIVCARILDVRDHATLLNLRTTPQGYSADVSFNRSANGSYVCGHDRFVACHDSLLDQHGVCSR
jgi:hypothetical protein